MFMHPVQAAISDSTETNILLGKTCRVFLSYSIFQSSRLLNDDLPLNAATFQRSTATKETRHRTSAAASIMAQVLARHCEFGNEATAMISSFTATDTTKVSPNHICKIFDRYAGARNARLIMSNMIPDMAYQAVVPYCIWHPDVATEETYRKLYYRYPEMRYHIGRACAVAGYGELYNALDLLPDVSIAEEARDNGKLDIFEHIMSQAELISMGIPLFDSPWKFIDQKWPSHYFNIQEDSNISGCPSPGPCFFKLQGEYIALLHTPLPEDLSPINKDILILTAAWDGNIERYFRLRRPIAVPNGITAVVRGAYHHTPFARWLESCVDELFPRQYENRLIRQAYHARFIMNDDLSSIDSEIDGEMLPELFWWPHSPHSDTLRELAWRRPDLKHQEEWEAAHHSYSEFFKETIELRAKEEAKTSMAGACLRIICSIFKCILRWPNSNKEYPSKRIVVCIQRWRITKDDQNHLHSLPIFPKFLELSHEFDDDSHLY
ncbi:uncharacterized protein CLUP02_09444 [Colletotrichum lupini]|uniref:Uncharacterized protein n=1 Tax=Colletotrichum lupini TaxID=145971 RepID=A0A9Q8WHL3_9PEZI|nr:uncharacterized protein CLUP02_09444 [Colletotrichum lupini]UQC83948.1 hypothetical protein CLUP02_09444 [Colletotrichum lupini]